MSSKEGDHGLANYYATTPATHQRGPDHVSDAGQPWWLKKPRAEDAELLPAFVSIAPDRLMNRRGALAAGFLDAAAYAPLIVGDSGRTYGSPADGDPRAPRPCGWRTLTPHAGIVGEHLEARLHLVMQMQHEFVGDHPAAAAASEPSDRLPASRPDDAHFRGEGVQSRRGTGQTS